MGNAVLRWLYLEMREEREVKSLFHLFPLNSRRAGFIYNEPRSESGGLFATSE